MDKITIDYEKYRHEWRLRKFQEGDIRSALIGLCPKGFKSIVMKSYFSFMGHSDFSYSIVSARRIQGRLRLLCRDVTREDANLVKEVLGLIPVIRTEDGVIYDTKDMDFRSLFPFGVSQSEATLINNILQ